MLKLNSRSAFAVLSAAALFSTSPAFAGGYEKPNTFSGKWGALGGAAASSVSGAEALFFNPAGLAAGDGTFDATANFSPTFLNFSGPIAGNASLDSKTSFFPGFGVFAGYKITPKWGVAIGTYLSGGAKAIYEGVDFSNSYVPFTGAVGANQAALANSDANVESQLSIIEFSAATGYEIVDGLRLGLGYRAAMVNAKLSSYGLDPTKHLLQTVTIDQINGWSWNGFRAGLQYYPKESRWGLGANWRSQVNFTGKGKLSGAITAGSLGSNPLSLPAGTKVALNESDATASSSLPMQFDFGGHFDIVPSGLRMYLQYTFTNYAVDHALALAGQPTITVSNTTVPLTALSGIDYNWVNQHDIRVGFDCFEVHNWVFRAGYVVSSQVTPRDRARATLTPPGIGHTIALGAGTSFLDGKLDTNLALEYAFASATSDGTNLPLDRTAGLAGTYKASDYAAHLGVTYRL